MKIDHVFFGVGKLCWCGGRKEQHRERIYHLAVNDPCETCGKPAKLHITERVVEGKRKRDKLRRDRSSRPIIGVDGEGHDLPDGRHIYTLILAVDETGRVVGRAENQSGLSTAEVLDMLLGLPQHALKFIFMGSYDWTKIIEDLDLPDIFYIMHPEARRARTCRKCKARWGIDQTICEGCGCTETRSIQKLQRVSKDKHGREIGASFDWFNGSFTVSRGKRRTKVWDCFKFFQCSFVKAIKQWKIGTPEQWAAIEAMKSKRGAFADETPEAIEGYCREECQLLAMMMREVLRACEAAGIKLRQYHGAGSIASALLKANNVKDYLGPPLEKMPEAMQLAVMSAYFGGRFENSVVGAVTEPVFNRDIFSAYPYAEARLPCLTCGKWKHVKRNVLEKARAGTLAVVRFRVKSCDLPTRETMAWAPLPFREESGSICFPTGFEGWAWMPELEAALRGWPKLIEVLEAWVYKTPCDHKPFGWIPAAYRKRFEWGKDGRGIVMKLGLNACAGKTMQNQGDPPPYKSWILGGMITSTTRSQGLDAIIVAKDRWNVLAIATDGVFATEFLPLPPAADTGTGDLEKPLGNWGCETHESGVFFVKPGMYFDEAAAIMRARGIGRAELNLHVQKLFGMFEDWDRKSPLELVVNSRRFYGARSSVLMYSQCLDCKKSWPGWPEKGCPICRQLGVCEAKYMTLPDRETGAYGRWWPRQIKIEFASYPKREAIARGGTFGRMRIRDLGGATSTPYDPGKTTPEGEAARIATLEALEEPDWDDVDQPTEFV